MTIAKGSFTVAMAPQSDEGFETGRFTLDKAYDGDLCGTGKGQMLSVRTETAGSAGYVALEMVEGSLSGKAGGFHLQHSGIMNRGDPSLSVTIVPDSGTGGLAGISGTLDITIDKDGGHFYELNYKFPSDD